jgi:membrane protein DedA with SNARE-associated domain
VSRRRLIVIAVLVAAAVAIWASGVLEDLPNAEQVIEDVATGLGDWTYLAVGLFAFLETGAFVGLVAPGESIVIVGGVIAGQGEISLLLLIGIVWVAAILGDTTSFYIGRRLGRDFMLRHGPKLKITEERLEQVEGYFHRHGGKTILIGRFIGLVRALAPFIAGSSRLPYRRFLPFSVVGTGLWATIFCVLGYIFYRSFDRVAAIAGQATLAFGVTVAVIAGGVLAWRRLRNEEERRKLAAWIERQAERPLLRPLAALLRPVWRRLLRPAWNAVAPRLRFLWGRITPGDLGLELTTALAFAGVGAYVFVLYVVVLSGDLGPTPLDTELIDLTRDMRGDAGVEVAKAISWFGSPWVFFTLVLVSAVVLAFQRQPYAVAALVIGAVVLYVALQVTKGALDRPRPAGSLVDTEGSAFPSGHAVYSTAWVMVAAITVYLRPALVRGALLFGASIVLAGAVGLSRIYLNAHWWSDVAGGWALGSAVFGSCGTVALIVYYFRHNERPARAPAQAAAEP